MAKYVSKSKSEVGRAMRHEDVQLELRNAGGNQAMQVHGVRRHRIRHNRQARTRIAWVIDHNNVRRRFRRQPTPILRNGTI